MRCVRCVLCVVRCACCLLVGVHGRLFVACGSLFVDCCLSILLFSSSFVCVCSPIVCWLRVVSSPLLFVG